MAMTPEEQEKETRRRRVAQADLRFDTQALRLPEKFIEENKAENSGPLVEPAILVIFLIALGFVGVVAFLISRS